MSARALLLASAFAAVASMASLAGHARASDGDRGGSGPPSGSMRIAVTTSFENSGLAEVLIPEIRNDLGIDLQVIVVGTGQALRLGAAGDVDAVLVHSPEAEREFVAAGHGVRRREIMYNDFVIVGPGDDPAEIAATASAAQALNRVLATGSAFVSRGDDSGTHRKELSLWRQAGADPEEFGGWYRATGSGMGAALNAASAMDAYVLSDRASWLKFSNKGGLALLFSGDPSLFNQYSFLPVNPERHPHVEAELAARLEDWLASSRARELIEGYEIDGVAPFAFNAKPVHDE